jgi:hypothetical protein
MTGLKNIVVLAVGLLAANAGLAMAQGGYWRSRQDVDPGRRPALAQGAGDSASRVSR